MKRSIKILLSIPPLLNLFYIVTALIPSISFYIAPSIISYQIQSLFVFIICVSHLIFLYKKLWSYNIQKDDKKFWAQSLILFYAISAFIFIWKKMDEFENKEV